MTGYSADYIWHKLSYAAGLQYQAVWMMEHNEDRCMSALAVFGGIKPFRLVYPFLDGDLGADSDLII